MPVSRSDCPGCEYEAYVSDLLADRRLRLDGSVAADVTDAERTLGRLDASASGFPNTEAFARLLLRGKSVASYIQGLVVGGRRLLRAEAARAAGATDIEVTPMRCSETSAP